MRPILLVVAVAGLLPICYSLPFPETPNEPEYNGETAEKLHGKDSLAGVRPKGKTNLNDGDGKNDAHDMIRQANHVCRLNHIPEMDTACDLITREGATLEKCVELAQHPGLNQQKFKDMCMDLIDQMGRIIKKTEGEIAKNSEDPTATEGDRIDNNGGENEQFEQSGTKRYDKTTRGSSLPEDNSTKTVEGKGANYPGLSDEKKGSSDDDDKDEDEEDEENHLDRKRN